MSSYGNQWFASSGVSDFYDHQIQHSIRMDENNSDHLRRTPSSAGNRTTWSFSVWLKRANLGSFQMIFEAGTSGNDSSRLWYD